MKKLKQLFQFFIYSNLFISCCATFMAWEAGYLFLDNQHNLYFLLFVFSATLCSYSFHWWLTPLLPDAAGERATWTMKNKQAYPALLGISSIAAIVTAMFLFNHWHWLFIAAFITFLYSAPKIPFPLFASLKKIAIGKTIFLAMVWTFVTAGLPLLINNSNWNAPFIYFFIGRFFVIYAICIIFDYRDKDYDKSTGIRSLITWLSTGKIRKLFFITILFHLLATVMLFCYAFPIYVPVLLLLPAIFTASLYSFATRHFSDRLYYFILDGLMALPAFLFFLLWLIKKLIPN